MSNSSQCTPYYIDEDTYATRDATIGCLSTIRNQLFCTCKLPTHPPEVHKQANQVESDHQKELDTDKIMKASVPPGIVARLMGLESMPEQNWIPKAKTVDPVRRSRSVNSIDYWSEFDPVQGRHRRVRTSLSFGEIPFVQIDNNEMLPVRTDNVYEKESTTKGSTPEISTGEVKQRKAGRVTNKKNSQQGVQEMKSKGAVKKDSNEKNCRRKWIADRPSQNAATRRAPKNACPMLPSEKKSTTTIGKNLPVNTSKANFTSKLARHRGVHKREISTNKGKRRHSPKKVEPECRLKILAVETKKQLTGSLSEKISRKKCSSSRRKFTVDYPNPNLASNISNSVNHKAISDQYAESTKLACYLKLWSDVFQLAKEDVGSTCLKPVEMWKSVYIEEIAMELGLRILDRLVHEVVAELSGFGSENLGLLLMLESP
ncbi:hypothetical protein IFM89_003981 [Coptis chinensis]|uniref:DUF3741 domain-containing protein n=1 Tax=Coptis chinensis TaxID=261450 RepID=A0A835H694_9MAGN|nr:hypothetical protein IFM89_003981 [Coptis chinensis]